MHISSIRHVLKGHAKFQNDWVSGSQDMTCDDMLLEEEDMTDQHLASWDLGASGLWLVYKVLQYGE